MIHHHSTTKHLQTKLSTQIIKPKIMAILQLKLPPKTLQAITLIPQFHLIIHTIKPTVIQALSKPIIQIKVLTKQKPQITKVFTDLHIILQQIFQVEGNQC
jgi:hypothetical protein